jgi:quercetin dioxygenase-like cupin family protein
MGYSVLRAEEASWRASNQMGVQNTNLGAQLGATTLSARVWLLQPGQASTRHRHPAAHELYVLLSGVGRVRVGGELLTLASGDALLVEPEIVRQLFNDTDEDQRWLVVGAPIERAATFEMLTPAELELMYPDGPQALPPELM